MPFLQTPRDRAGALIVVLAGAILLALSPFLSGLLGAAVLYVIFVTPYRRLARAIRPGPASAVVLVGALFIIAVPLSWLIGMVIDQAPDALRSVQGSALFARVGQLRIAGYDVGAEVAKASGTLVSWLSGQLFSFVGSATSAALNLVIAFFGLYYLLQSGEVSWPVIRTYIPFSARTADALRDRFFSVTEATLLGTAAVAVIQGGLVGLGFWIVGLPNAFFWGTITAFASILPVLGSALVWLPAALILLAQNRFGAAATLVVIGGGIASNVDNLIRPVVYKRVSNIHPMITLVGAFAGVRYFGLLGLLLGPLAIAYLFELLRFYREEYGEQEPAATAPDQALRTNPARSSAG
ncbi:MAG TPA: AI-2E family transporter [Gemmatimonadaceae bacterium]